jgi:hypothetical protein
LIPSAINGSKDKDLQDSKVQKHVVLVPGGKAVLAMLACTAILVMANQGKMHVMQLIAFKTALMS